MESKYVYTFRGLIAFVAFSDLGSAVQAFVERKCVLNEFVPSADVSPLPRIYGMFFILQALILIHCTLYIHYKPLISLGIFSMVICIFMHLEETIIFESASLNFKTIFPCFLNAITMIGLLIMLFHSKKDDTIDENVELLKMANKLERSFLNRKVKQP